MAGKVQGPGVMGLPQRPVAKRRQNTCWPSQTLLSGEVQPTKRFCKCGFGDRSLQQKVYKGSLPRDSPSPSPAKVHRPRPSIRSSNNRRALFQPCRGKVPTVHHQKLMKSIHRSGKMGWQGLQRAEHWLPRDCATGPHQGRAHLYRYRPKPTAPATPADVNKKLEDYGTQLGSI